MRVAFYPHPLLRHFLGAICFFGFLAFSIPAFAGTEAEAILKAARVNPLGNQITLNAQLRSGRTNTPFQIVVDGKVSYEFENPTQALILDLGDDESRLTERKGAKNAPIKAARYDERVRGTDISFEDLALKFLYWKHPKILGEETIRSRKSWKFEIQAPRGSSQYGVARLWIDKEGGALMRVEGYDPQGRLIRKFEVVDVQRIDGQWMLKSMRIETINPETKKVISRTYLDVLGKAEA
ncbi:MAG: outer membrane lipoprotein-sorting protein [Terrimicrobiaceae bacterium]